MEKYSDQLRRFASMLDNDFDHNAAKVAEELQSLGFRLAISKLREEIRDATGV